MPNNTLNGYTPETKFFNGLSSIPNVALVRPVTTAGGTTGNGRFSYLNPAAGCRGFATTTLPAGASATAPSVVCNVDQQELYSMLQPDVERYGVSMRFTANIGENHHFYASGNFYQTDSYAQLAPGGFNGTPSAPESGAVSYNMILPVYVCGSGVGTRNGLNTGCTAANGTLNPMNPYAAAGQTAHVLLRSNRPRTDEASARALRGAIGINGTFAEHWNYSADFTVSNVQLTRTQANYFIPQRIMDAVARGQLNVMDLDANPQSVWDYISPTKVNRSTSDLWQASATIGRELFQLPGGPLSFALGASYRHESIDAPSANPQNDAHPYDRYYSINSVGTSGSRNVFSAFGEINAPVFDQLELNFAGRYDDYSSGQSNFSPKVGFKFTPIPQVALRGTWSRGFRIPSFNEAYGLPTTGFVNQLIDCKKYAAFCSAHGNNGYATGQVSVGLTQTGNPQLDPEKSESMTLGLVIEPVRNVSFTVDLWRIKVKNLIVGITDISPALDQYYRNNGVVNIPGITVTPGQPDVANPNALPHIGYIASSYVNANRQLVQGIDLGMNARFNLSDNVRWISSVEASYLDKNHLTPIDPFTGDVGDTLKYEGSLSPCNITSCSGSPRWRASWQNTLEFGNTTVSVTAYYTAGYDVASVDFGATPGDCDSALEFGSAVPYGDGTPVMCRAKPTWNVDLTASHKINDRFTIYANILNVLDLKAPFEPSAAYHLFQYNPAWAGANMMGRYFRIGAKVDF